MHVLTAAAAAVLVLIGTAQAQDNCAAIRHQYGQAQKQIIESRLELLGAKSAPQQSVGWLSIQAGQNALSLAVSIAQQNGCPLQPPRYMLGIVDPAKDRACAAVYAVLHDLEDQACAHIRNALEAIGGKSG